MPHVLRLHSSEDGPCHPRRRQADKRSVDGVLLRSSKPLPGASKTLSYLQSHRIPFILLTNGGGKTEDQRVADLTEHLGVPLNTDMFVQSHTPFAQLVHGYGGAPALRDRCVLVLGGEGNQCRNVAEKYGPGS